MKRILTALGVIVLLAVSISYWFQSHREDEMGRMRTGSNESETWVPSDEELAKGNKGVGWVFGRMIGVAEAPGSPNHSPFGAATFQQPSAAQ